MIHTFFATLIEDPETSQASAGYIMDVTNGLNQESGSLTDIDRTGLLNLEVVLFPMFSANAEHWVLFAVIPDAKKIRYYDSLTDGLRSLGDLIKDWLGKVLGNLYTDDWVVEHSIRPTQGENSSCAVCTCINGMLLLLGERPEGAYGRPDVPFLRGYLAAVICESEIPAGSNAGHQCSPH